MLSPPLSALQLLLSISLLHTKISHFPPFVQFTVKSLAKLLHMLVTLPSKFLACSSFTTCSVLYQSQLHLHSAFLKCFFPIEVTAIPSDYIYMTLVNGYLTIGATWHFSIPDAIKTLYFDTTNGNETQVTFFFNGTWTKRLIKHISFWGSYWWLSADTLVWGWER